MRRSLLGAVFMLILAVLACNAQQPGSPVPLPVCTPPLCAEDEVYYCPDECPGGCGTRCATPTPASQSLPTILSFTADRTTIAEGESVTLSWQATGGTEALIQWVNHEGELVTVPEALNPDGGEVTVAPTGNGDIVLIVKNGAVSVESHVQLTITSP